MLPMAKVDQGLALVTGGPEDRSRRPEQEIMSRSLGKLCASGDTKAWRKHRGLSYTHLGLSIERLGMSPFASLGLSFTFLAGLQRGLSGTMDVRQGCWLPSSAPVAAQPGCAFQPPLRCCGAVNTEFQPQNKGGSKVTC